MKTNSDESIEKLIAQARCGDDGALGRILDSFHSYLRLLARLRLDQRLQAKVSPSDVVQETFLSAKTAFPRFRGQSERELMAWLRSILAAEIAGQARYFRRDRRTIELERRLCNELDQTSAGLVQGIVDPGASPSVIAARREAELILADQLDRLRHDHREVIILHNFQHQTFPEVAQTMGRSTAAVKSLWVRALANLRRAIDGNDLAEGDDHSAPHDGEES